MGSVRLGEMISEELIKKSCSLSFSGNNELFHVDKGLPDAVVFAFNGVWTVKEWFSGDQSFGETKIKTEEWSWSKKVFPSMRSLGNDEVAIFNQAFLERFRLVLNVHEFEVQVCC